MLPKIDQPTADLIRKLRREDGIPVKILAWRFGVAKSTISAIINDLTWRNEDTCPDCTPLPSSCSTKSTSIAG
jgi:hypothetical protein